MWVRTLAVVLLLAGPAFGQATQPAVGQTPQPASQTGVQAGTESGDKSAEVRFAEERGQLLVWRIVATSPLRPVLPTSLSPDLKTQTAGSFGQTAGSFGQTAGSTGQTASSLGQTAGSTGQTAGSTGQTAGSFGQTASSVGQTAGSTGQTAGNFGESLDSLPGAAERANGSAPQVKTDSEWDRFLQSAHSEFRALEVVYEDVGSDELEARLRKRSPDVLVGTPLPASWSNQDSGLVRRYGIVTLGSATAIPQHETPEPAVSSFKVEGSALRAAHNPTGARDFVLWLSGQGTCGACDKNSSPIQTATVLAKSALSDTLNGLTLGKTADPEAAPFNARLAQQTALNITVPSLLTGLNISIEVTQVAANTRFAAVALRAVAESSRAFGVVHAVVVLRTDDAGKWHVLQVTPSLLVGQQQFAWGMFRPFGATVPPEELATVLGVTQAAPGDGDSREPAPEFWWDNRGGANLEVVEWQRKAGAGVSDAGWTNSNLFFVPDDSGHLRTQVTGRFADMPGAYIWRVWSVGVGGVVVISPWRSVNIIAH